MTRLLIIMSFAFLTVGSYAGDGSVVRVQNRHTGSYLALFDERRLEDAGDVTNRLAHAHGFKPTHIYRTVVRGFSFVGSEAVARAISADPSVRLVEEDATVEPLAITRTAFFGLDRIDQVNLPLDGIFRQEYTGYGVAIYIVDSGINYLPDFGDRIREQKNFAADSSGVIDPNDVSDHISHGTRVASIAAGRIYGVATGASVVNVRVLGADGGGRLSDMIAGVDWMTSDHVANHPTEGAVANVSIGILNCGISSTFDAALQRAVQSGITVIVAAGNCPADACTESPARTGNPDVNGWGFGRSTISVGYTNSRDMIDISSSYGRCVDIFAPGSSVLSESGDGRPSYGSGSSFAAPYVAGVAALHIHRYGIVNSPSTIEGIIKDAGTPGVLQPPAGYPVAPGPTTLYMGSPNLLLYSSVPIRRACCL